MLERIAFFGANMDSQLSPRSCLLGGELTVLDYVAVVSRFGQWRERFVVAPNMAAAVHRVDAAPRLTALWAERFPED